MSVDLLWKLNFKKNSKKSKENRTRVIAFTCNIKNPFQFEKNSIPAEGRVANAFLCVMTFLFLWIWKIVSFVHVVYSDAHRNLLQSGAKLRLNTEIFMAIFFPSHLDSFYNCFSKYFPETFFCYFVLMLAKLWDELEFP